MLILSVPAILIGIACSLILIGAMKVAALLQRVLWSNLPAQLGMSATARYGLSPCSRRQGSPWV
jgi:hypothetical protein